jgi:chromate transporter
MSTVALPIVTSVRLGNGRFSLAANEPRAARATRSGTPWEVLLAFLQLGLTSFGGPFAHLGYFRSEFVERRRWVSEDVYADLVALGQFLPGPASSQVGMALGMVRAGPAGMAAAWLGFTLPSAALMIAFAFGVSSLGDLAHAAWLKGLKLVAVAVVAQAVWGMARNLCPDRPRATLAVAACLLALTIPSAAGQISAIALGAAVGYTILPREPLSFAGKLPIMASGSRMGALCCLALFFGLLFLLPALADVAGNHALNLIAAFYRVGSLIFGGGHVMLPLLRAAVVPPGWISNDTFLAGYGAAQAIPGPLSSFAGYLGVLMQPGPNGWVGGVLCIVSIFLPSFSWRARCRSGICCAAVPACRRHCEA